MVTEIDALKAELAFRDNLQKDVVLDNSNKIAFSNGKYWWENCGTNYGFPIKRVWCGAYMEFIYLEFTDDNYIGMKIRST